MKRSRTFTWALVSGAVLAAVAGAIATRGWNAEAAATELYYVVVYGAQADGDHPETSHCFATFARIVPASRRGAEPRVELHHINWFSRSGHETGRTTCIFKADGQPTLPEPGENRTTRDALLLARNCGLRVTRWGPIEIDRALFEQALRQIDLLEGRVPGYRALYKSFDLGCRSGGPVRLYNCIHAISDVRRETGLLRTWVSYGAEAARQVALHLGRLTENPGPGCSDAWALIWAATWRPGPAPADLRLVDGGLPWRDQVPTTRPDGNPAPATTLAESSRATPEGLARGDGLLDVLARSFRGD